MNIKITADSTCDLSPALIEKHQITIVPLTVHKGDGIYRDGVDIVPQDIFDHVASGGPLCTTSAPNVQEYRTVFREFAARYEAVMHISIGSGFSASYEHACAAASGFGNVRVVDSKNLSTGQGLVVLSACDMAAASTDIDEMHTALCKLAQRVEASFLMDRLEYMVKGGRCSSAQMLGANLLSLKPCIEVKDGKMQVAKKYRGSLERCVRMYIQERLYRREDIAHGRLFLTHTPLPEQAMQAARDTVGRLAEFEQVYETTAGCTVSCHCGPGTLGVLFLRAEP